MKSQAKKAQKQFKAVLTRQYGRLRELLVFISNRVLPGLFGPIVAGIVFGVSAGSSLGFTGSWFVRTALAFSFLAVSIGLLSDEQKESEKKRSRRDRFGALVLATIVPLGILTLVRDTPEPSRLAGDFNVVVAEFGAVNVGDDPIRGADLAANVRLALGKKLDALASQNDKIIDLSPDIAPGLTSENRDRRAERAKELATQSNASVVIYGTISGKGDELTFEPEFYLSPNFFQPELSGQYLLGSPISIARTVNLSADQATIRSALIDRVAVLTRVFLGLISYAQADYETASQYFQEAIDDAEWGDDEGKEIAYLLLGNSLSRHDLDNLPESAAAYERALEIEPEYSRARLGLAETVFHSASGCQAGDNSDCCEASTVDRNQLQESLDSYDEVLTAEKQVSVNFSEHKVLFGKARLFICAHLAGADDLDISGERGLVQLAYDNYQEVVQTYRSTEDPEIRWLAAESLAGQGLILHLGESDEANLEAAQNKYVEAAELARESSGRKSDHFASAGEIALELGRPGVAGGYFRDAAEAESDPDRKEQFEEMADRHS